MAKLRTEPPPMTPCEKLAAAEAQLALLLSGKSVRVVETPQLGRVEYAGTSAADLSRLINALKGECAESLGLTSGTGRRGPISVEVCP
jgi:hypothetical protein